ncbi:MAG: PIN domain-containing protein [Methylococcaceae bacterium]|nr:PIN domain-containing protein [Methylococcaceae bacterium]
MPKCEAAVVAPAMNKILTYVDANVLIAAFRGQSIVSQAAVAVLRDPGRALLVSDALWLEIVPKARFHRQQHEVDFYEGIFTLALKRVCWNETIMEKACELAPRYGMAAMDAIHVASALIGGAEELVTGEGWNKPMLHVQELRTHSIQLRTEPTKR